MFEQRSVATEFVVDEDCVGSNHLRWAQTTAPEGVASTRMSWLVGRDSTPFSMSRASRRRAMANRDAAEDLPTSRMRPQE
jgi:hypothetical protein